MRFVLCFAVAGALAALAVNLLIPLLARTPAEYAALVAVGGVYAVLGVMPFVRRLRAAAQDDYLWDHVMGWSTAVVAAAHVTLCALGGIYAAVTDFTWPDEVNVLSVLGGAVMGVVVWVAGAVVIGAITLVFVGWITVPFGSVAGLIAAAGARRAAARAEAATAFSSAVHPVEEETS